MITHITGLILYLPYRMTDYCAEAFFFGPSWIAEIDFMMKPIFGKVCFNPLVPHVVIHPPNRLWLRIVAPYVHTLYA